MHVNERHRNAQHTAVASTRRIVGDAKNAMRARPHARILRCAVRAGLLIKAVAGAATSATSLVKDEATAAIFHVVVIAVSRWVE